MQIFNTTSDDGTAIRVVRWFPEDANNQDRDILLVHGLAEHAGRYPHIAAARTDAGWTVTFVELRGHGQSGGKRGHTDLWHHYIEDIQSAASMIGRPYVLIGHSMGGLTALATLLEPQHPPVRAVAVSNPLLGVDFEPTRIKVAASRLLSKLVPKLSFSNEVQTHHLCRDPEVVARYEADPNVYSTITPRWYIELTTTQKSVLANAKNGRIPLRMMVGTADKICSHTLSLEFARKGGGPTDIQVYDGLYHELFNEPEKDQVLTDLRAWLEEIDQTLAENDA